jgi:M6 family metalloprotease-like protein
MRIKFEIKILLLTAFLLFLSITTTVDGVELILDKSQHHVVPNQSQTSERLIRKQIKYKGNPAFNNRDLIARIRSTAKENRSDTVKVLALRVEFLEDSTLLTTGNGKMDLAGFLTPDDGLLYDPPHTRRYFERQLQGMRNYYWLNSKGKLYIDYKVMPNTVINCYQLPHQMIYYGDTASIEGMETGLCRLMRDAIMIADQDPTLRFSDYDLIIIFHAGSAPQSDIAQNSPFDLLAGTIPSSALETYLGVSYILADEGETRISSATIMPEMMRQDTSYQGQVNILGMLGLAGTLYHEFTHLLGGYDLYDVTGYSMGVGSWSLMGTGAWLGDWSVGAPPGAIPGMLDAFHKVYFGWVEPYVVNIPKESIPIFVATMDTTRFRLHGDSTAPLIIKIPISQTEYFLIENRKTDTRKNDTIVVDTEDGVLVWVEDGEYDFFQPGSGVLIWHVDSQVIADYGPYNAINIFPDHKGVDLEEGDGIQDYDGWSGISQWDYQYYGSNNDPFYVGGFNSEFSSLTTPNSDGYYGKTHITVSTLSAPDTAMMISIKFGFNQRGFPKDPGRNIILLSAHAVDLDRDGLLEVVVADSGGRIFAWHSDGSSYLTNTQGSFAQLSTTLIGTPAIGDVAGDDKLEVVCAGENGKVYICSSTGLPPYTQMTTNDRILASPTLADLDGDGKKEIIVGSTDMRLYVWKGDGSLYPGFPMFLNSELRSSVAVTDTVNSRIIVLGSDNRLFLINPSDATVVNRFPLTLSNSALYTTVPPVVGDVDRDGEKEIIVIVHSEIDYKLFIVDFSGKIKYSSPDKISNPVNTAPLLADLDNDGYLDIIVAGKNRIYAFNYNATLKTNYPFAQDSVYTTIQVIGGYLFTVEVPFIFNSSPIIYDINNDILPDIIIGSPRYGLLALDGRTGRLLSDFPLATVGGVSATPMISDIDSDGEVEISAGSDLGVFYTWEFPMGAHPYLWNQYLHDPCHTGLYPETPEIVSPPDVIVKNFYAYPNPAGNRVTVRYWLGRNTKNVKINILDITGESKSEFAGNTYPLTDNENTLSLTEIPSGIYILRLEVTSETKKEIKFYKFAVVK